MENLPQIPACTHISDPPCDALVRDPEAVLSDPDRWPRHLCSPVAWLTTRHWAMKQAEAHYGHDAPAEVLAWAELWPLPVGKPLLSRQPVPSHLLPLQLPVKAALILEPDIPFVTTCAAFGLVDDLPAVCDDAHPFRLADMHVTITGGGLTERCVRFHKLAWRWWRGEKAYGRKRGSNVTRQQAIDAYLAYHVEMGKYPSQDELAAELECTPRSLRTVIAQPWKDFEGSAKAWQAHELRQLRETKAFIEFRMRETGN